MSVDSENAIPVDEDANVTVMKELGLLSGEEQSSSKITGITKETFDWATSPIEVVSTTPGMWMTRFQRNSLAVKSNTLYVRSVLKKFP
ncbi:hypothetical protein RclHR1_10260009 [Rhizophagus clarus]|uniref:Uncharacterized protein n=1 Tax=Rhizophagus clarus TaxID=94130 RepID=A0A2Z6QT86_9GLOM|nr:hypothetical protein RclHR1_10260009 [Rhizophagus clarus]